MKNLFLLAITCVSLNAMSDEIVFNKFVGSWHVVHCSTGQAVNRLEIIKTQEGNLVGSYYMKNGVKTSDFGTKNETVIQENDSLKIKVKTTTTSKIFGDKVVIARSSATVEASEDQEFFGNTITEMKVQEDKLEVASDATFYTVNGSKNYRILCEYVK